MESVNISEEELAAQVAEADTEFEAADKAAYEAHLRVEAARRVFDERVAAAQADLDVVLRESETAVRNQREKMEAARNLKRELHRAQGKYVG